MTFEQKTFTFGLGGWHWDSVFYSPEHRSYNSSSPLQEDLGHCSHLSQSVGLSSLRLRGPRHAGLSFPSQWAFMCSHLLWDTFLYPGPSSFELVSMLLSCQVPLWKYYILIYNVQKSLWFTNPGHIPNINCFFSVVGESTVVSAFTACSFFICPSSEHLVPSRTPVWGIREAMGRD